MLCSFGTYTEASAPPVLSLIFRSGGRYSYLYACGTLYNQIGKLPYYVFIIILFTVYCIETQKKKYEGSVKDEDPKG